MAVGEEDSSVSKLVGISEEGTSALVPMETLPTHQDGGEVVGGMASHNGLPGYSPPRERQDSEATLGVGEVVEEEELEEEDEEDESYVTRERGEEGEGGRKGQMDSWTSLTSLLSPHRDTEEGSPQDLGIKHEPSSPPSLPPLSPHTQHTLPYTVSINPPT